MPAYVHLLGYSDAVAAVARQILSFEHWGHFTRIWVENDDHEPRGYVVSGDDPGMPSWKVIMCGNELCTVKDCVRKAYYEQLHLPTMKEIIDRDMRADQTETLAEMIKENAALSEESEARRQEIVWLKDRLQRYRNRVSTAVKVLEESQEDSDILLVHGLRELLDNDRYGG